MIYREARAAERKNAGAASDVAQPHPSIRITRADGSLSPLDMGRLNTIISEACEGPAEVDGALIERETLKNLYDGVAEKDVIHRPGDDRAPWSSASRTTPTSPPAC
ncbi:hypothetical protein P4234_28245 [Pseudomonas aeruginosa]|nr:hypothetical protein [Pseudomonas aeruginosa]